MVPEDEFTPHGYLDNPYHSWKLNPSGVVRSLAPLGMGWHVPNLGSYVRNQFQYTAHLSLGLKIGDLVLMTPDDFKHHHCVITSHLHTKNRFAYSCYVPYYGLTVTATYFLAHEHALGAVITLTSMEPKPLPVTCYLLHLHTHNPYTSRLWEHGLYVSAGVEAGSAMLGIASEGDVFVHGWRAAHEGEADSGATQTFQPVEYMTTLDDAARFARGEMVARPAITQQQEDTGWQTRVVLLPCALTLIGGKVRTFHAVLARGVSQDTAWQYWQNSMKQLTQVEALHRVNDEQFWSGAPQLSGDWPASWRRGFVYDLETLRMVMRPPAGIIPHTWDGMQIQAPRTVLAEAAMDALFLSYADCQLAADVLLGHFESSPHPQLPCMREDGSYNMVADDGQICGTAPEWGFPVWCCDLIVRRTGDLHWLRRLYPHVAAYLRWWLEHRRDREGWLVYACSWESGQDVSSRFGPQQTGGTIIQHVRPVDLQASMMQSAEILARWAGLLAIESERLVVDKTAPAINFAEEQLYWQRLADEFMIRTRKLWHNGWFHDFDAVAQEWSSQQDTMHLAPVFCGAAGWGHIEQLRPYLILPPGHSSGWTPLSWPPVVMTLVGAADAAELTADAVEQTYEFIDAAYRSIDQREADEHGGIPGVTREYHASIVTGKWGKMEYVNAGIEGYGWGALSVYLLLRYVMGLREVDAHTIKVMPILPSALRRTGSVYCVGPVQWGQYLLQVECSVQTSKRYHLRIWCRVAAESTHASQRWEWDAAWGEKHLLSLASSPYPR